LTGWYDEKMVCGHGVCRYKAEGMQTYSLYFKCLTTQ